MTPLVPRYWAQAAAVAVLLIATPALAWQVRFDGSLHSLDEGGDAVGLPSGDVIAVGTLTETGNRPVAIAVRLAAADGAEIWRYAVPLDDPQQGSSFSRVELGPDGNPIIAGQLLPDAASDGDWLVVKLSAGTGGELWRYSFATPRRDLIRAFALDAGGDALLTGFTDNDPLGAGIPADMTVAKLSNADGTELWRVEVTGSADAADLGSDQGSGIGADAAGDVLVAGKIENDGPDGEDVIVAKLSGVDGAEMWRREIAGSAGDRDDAEGMTVLPGGDAVVVAGMKSAGTGTDIGVYRIANADGSIVWGRELNGSSGANDLVLDVRADGNGDVIVAGALDQATTSQDFTVLKLDGATGADIWAYQDAGLQGAGVADWASRVAVSSSGDVAAVGQVFPNFAPGEPPVGVRIVKLDGSDGSELWASSIATTGEISFMSGKAVRFDASDSVLAVGDATQICASFDFSVVRLDGADGSGADNDLHPGDCALSGDRLTLSDRAPNKQLLVLKSKDRAERSIGWFSKIPLPTQGNVDADPTLFGAVLEVLNPDTGEFSSIDLPAQFWSAEIRVPLIGFRESFEYSDPKREAGPCTSVKFFPQKGTPLRIKCKGALGLSLDEPSQGRMMVRLVLGAASKARYCVEFGGEVGRDRSGKFQARKSPAPAACDVLL